MTKQQTPSWIKQALNTDKDKEAVKPFEKMNGIAESPYIGGKRVKAIGNPKRELGKAYALQLNNDIRARLENNCDCSLNTSINVLLDYALSKLEEEGKSIVIDCEKRY